MHACTHAYTANDYANSRLDGCTRLAVPVARWSTASHELPGTSNTTARHAAGRIGHLPLRIREYANKKNKRNNELYQLWRLF